MTVSDLSGIGGEHVPDRRTSIKQLLLYNLFVDFVLPYDQYSVDLPYTHEKSQYVLIFPQKKYGVLF